MIEFPFPHDTALFDAYRAKHAKVGHYNSPLVLFDTGELICTEYTPNPEARGEYSEVGVTITTSENTYLRIPDGDAVPRAWLDDNGMQYLLHDHSTNHVVRLDGPRRHRNSKGMHFTHGIPLRFQYNCTAYIGGAGLAPIAHEKIKLSIPLNKAGYTTDQLEHIQMIVNTGQAAMRLTDHVAVHRRGSIGADPDIILRCQTWEDMPEAQLPMLLHRGARRVTRYYDYLLAGA
jgi:hypothetical protein